MELTNILGKFKSQEEPPKPFLALELTDELTQAAVWQVQDGVTEVVSLGIPVEWQEDEKGESLIQAVDATISAATEGLNPEPTGVVFGLPSAWTNESGIAPSKLAHIKLISRELELKPLGYVSVIDSLIRFLKMQEGTPSTSILIQVGGSEITVHHVNLGQVEGKTVVARSDDIAKDVEEGIARLKTIGHLPSRIIVFDGMHNLEEIVQNLVSFNWQSKFDFLHLPKVESLQKDVVIRSIAIAGGAEVAKAIGFEITESKPDSTPVTDLPVETPTPEPPPIPAKLTPASELGFASNVTPPRPALNQTTNGTPPSAGQSPSSPPPLHSSTAPKHKLPRPPRISLPKFSVPIGTGLGRNLILALAALLLFLALAGLGVWFLPHAEVTILVEPKTLPETITLTLSTATDQADPQSGVVPAKTLETTVSGSSSAAATGTKTVGEPSRGEVTIFNRTNLSKTFAAGTVLTAKGISFTLDESVSVASSSAGTDYAEIPGKATAKLTASQIGEEGNLGENTEFTLEDYSLGTYVARNESSLSGGSSREVDVVSQDDLDQLVESLSTSLADQARQQLLASAGANSGIYILSDNLDVITETYSVEVGEEASSVDATLEVQVQGIEYQLADVAALVDSAIQTAIPSEYERTGDPPKVELSDAVRESDEEIIADAKVSILLKPRINSQTIQKSIKGKTEAEIESILISNIPGFRTAHVKITPKLLSTSFKRMPRNPANISLIIVSTP